MKKYLSLFLAITMVAALFVGGAAVEANAEGARDTLVISMAQEPTTVNFHASGFVTTQQTAHLCAGYLLKIAADGSVAPYIAESWEYASDTELVMKLREDVYWHNGRLLTADDVVFTFEWMMNQDNGSVYFSNFNGKVEKVEKTGDFEVKFTLVAPYPPFLELLAWNCPLVAEDIMDTLDTNPIGCGPFKFISWDHNQQINYEVFDQYFDRDKIAYDKLTLRCFQDSNAQMTAFLAGEVDFVNVDANDVDMIAAKEEYKIQSTQNNIWFIGCNSSVGVFANEKVRQAAKYAIDKDEIIEIAMNGQGIPVSQFVLPGTTYYDESLDWTQDLEKAKQLLAEAGYPNGGCEFTLTGSNDATTRNVMTVLQYQFEAAGFKVNLNCADAGEWWEKYTKGELEMAVNSYGVYNDPAFRTTYLLTTGSAVRFGYHNDEYDELYAKGLVERDEEARKAIYSRMFEIAIDDAGFFNLFAPETFCGVKSEIEGLEFHDNGNSDFTGVTFKG